MQRSQFSSHFTDSKIAGNRPWHFANPNVWLNFPRNGPNLLLPLDVSRQKAFSFRGLRPLTPHQGLCPWAPLAPLPDPRYRLALLRSPHAPAPPELKSCVRPCSDVAYLWSHAPCVYVNKAVWSWLCIPANLPSQYDLTWIQSSSIRQLTVSLIVLLFCDFCCPLLSVLFPSPYLSMMLPNRGVFGFPLFLFLIRIVCLFLKKLCRRMWTNIVISLSLHLLTKFFLLQLFPESIHWFFLLSMTLVGSGLIPSLQMLLFVTRQIYSSSSLRIHRWQPTLQSFLVTELYSVYWDVMTLPGKTLYRFQVLCECLLCILHHQWSRFLGIWIHLPVAVFDKDIPHLFLHVATTFMLSILSYFICIYLFIYGIWYGMV